MMHPIQCNSSSNPNYNAVSTPDHLNYLLLPIVACKGRIKTMSSVLGSSRQALSIDTIIKRYIDPF